MYLFLFTASRTRYYNNDNVIIDYMYDLSRWRRRETNDVLQLPAHASPMHTDAQDAIVKMFIQGDLADTRHHHTRVRVLAIYHIGCTAAVVFHIRYLDMYIEKPLQNRACIVFSFGIGLARLIYYYILCYYHYHYIIVPNRFCVYLCFPVVLHGGIHCHRDCKKINFRYTWTNTRPKFPRGC